MATAVKAASAGMTGAVRSLQWTIQDMNGSVEHLGHSHDHLRRAQNMMAWTTAIFGALLLSGLVWIANDIFHLKDQLVESDRRFDAVDAQMNALGARMDDLNLAIEQVGAQLVAARGSQAPASGLAPATGPDVSVLSSPAIPQSFQTAANAPLEAQIPDAAAQPQVFQAQPAGAVQQQAALASVEQQGQSVTVAAPDPAVAVIPPSPPAPRDQLTPDELAAPAPVLAAAAPAAPVAEVAPSAPAAAEDAGDARSTEVAAAAPAPAPAVAAAPAAGANLSDDQLLSFNDDQIDPADELLLLDENGNSQ